MVHLARSHSLLDCHAPKPYKRKEKLIRTSLTLLYSVHVVKTYLNCFFHVSAGYLHDSTLLCLAAIYMYLSVATSSSRVLTFADFNFGKSCHIWFLAIVLVLCVRLVRNCCCCCCCLSLLGFCFFFSVASASGFIAFVFYVLPRHP